MAYNPFDFFRRNQKSFFAVLTAFVMVMFVFSFGQGDFFQWLPRWIGNKRGQGDVLATVNGSKVYSSELQRIRENRFLANRFMTQSNAAAAENISRDLGAKMDGAGDIAKNAIQKMLVERLSNYVPMQYFQMYQQGMIGPELLMQGRNQNLQMLRNQLQMIIVGASGESKDIKKSDVDLAKAAQNLMLLDEVSELARASNTYFLNLPLNEKEGEGELLQFDLWLRKADKLGIQFSKRDVLVLYKDEFYGRINDETVGSILSSYSDRVGFTQEKLWESLADEFRVRAAQGVVLGPAYGRAGGVAMQALTAPYEDYQFYRDQVVAATYAMMTVPVDNYLDKVTATPSEGELRELFSKYRDKEPNPAVETPGFKKPRELKVAWMEVKGTEPFYTKAGTEVMKQTEIAAKLAMALVPPTGGAELALPGSLFPLAMVDPALAMEYQQYRSKMLVALDNAYTSWNLSFQHEVPESSLAKPANLGSSLGMLLGGSITHAYPMSSALALIERSRHEDRLVRARILGMALAPSGIAAGGNLLATGTSMAAALPQPLPLSAVRNDLMESVRKRVIQMVAKNDLDKLIQDITPLGLKKDKSEARSMLERYVAERGLTVVQSAGFRDVFNMDSDPALQPLVEYRKSGRAGDNPQAPFGQTFFVERDEKDFRAQRFVLASSFFSPRTYATMQSQVNFTEGEPTYLYWRTDEVAAEVPKDIEKVRDKVVTAWKRLKARDLAKEAAEDLAKQVRDTAAKTPGSDQQGILDQLVRDLHTKYSTAFGNIDKAMRASYFLETGVAPFPDIPVSTGGVNAQYSPYVLKIRDTLKYPTSEMADDLVKNKDKPLGTTLVMNDRPRDSYYVAVLLTRSERSSETFYEQIYRSTAANQLAQAIRSQERSNTARLARQQAQALLEAEFRVEKTDKLKKAKTMSDEIQ